MNWDLRTWRSNLRLISALVLLSFVICHLTAHCLLLISFESGDAARNILMYPWRTWIGTRLLMTALLVHYANALWSIYIRRSLRLSHWEWAQLSLGLCIPDAVDDPCRWRRASRRACWTFTSYYNTVLIVQWLVFPWLGVVQAIAVLTVWTHACIGLHFWLRTKPWYPGLAAVVVRLRPAAADLGACRLRCGGQ